MTIDYHDPAAVHKLRLAIDRVTQMYTTSSPAPSAQHSKIRQAIAILYALRKQRGGSLPPVRETAKILQLSHGTTYRAMRKLSA